MDLLKTITGMTLDESRLGGMGKDVVHGVEVDWLDGFKGHRGCAYSTVDEA